MNPSDNVDKATGAEEFDARAYMLDTDEIELEHLLITSGFKRFDFNDWSKQEIVDGPKIGDPKGAWKTCRYDHDVEKHGSQWVYMRLCARGHLQTIDSTVVGTANQIIDALETWDKQQALRSYLYQESDDFNAREFLLNASEPEGKEFWVCFQEDDSKRAVKLLSFKAAVRFIHDKNLEQDLSLVLKVKQADESSVNYQRQPDGTYEEMKVPGWEMVEAGDPESVQRLLQQFVALGLKDAPRLKVETNVSCNDVDCVGGRREFLPVAVVSYDTMQKYIVPRDGGFLVPVPVKDNWHIHKLTEEQLQQVIQSLGPENTLDDFYQACAGAGPLWRRYYETQESPKPLDETRAVGIAHALLDADEFDAREFLLNGPGPDDELRQELRGYGFKQVKARTAEDTNEVWQVKRGEVVHSVRQREGGEGWFYHRNTIPDYNFMTGAANMVRTLPRYMREAEEFDARDYLLNEPYKKPFGYVLKSTALEGRSPTPWLNAKAQRFEQNIGDASVFKRRQTAEHWPALEIVPVYSDPRKTGEGALDPYYKPRVYDFSRRRVAEADEFDARAFILDTSSELEALVERGILLLSAGVYRHSSRYVHESSTTFTMDASYAWPDDMPEDAQRQEEQRVDPLVNKLEETLKEQIVAWNRKIYAELEAAYNDSLSVEVVADNIQANEYAFDEEGEFNAGELHYEQLSPESKARAREWWIEQSSGDTDFAEPVIAEWKWLLQRKGFENVDIAWSGFSTQGDGASFTALSLDFQTYFNGPDSLTFPEQDREQFAESVNEADEFDAREFLLQTPFQRDAVYVGEDIWSDDNKLRKVFAWQTKIGLAPKFGTTSIANYQHEQCKQFDALHDMAQQRNIGKLEWVRYRNGVILAFDASAYKWIRLARTMYGHLLPCVNEEEEFKPEQPAEEFDARQYCMDTNDPIRLMKQFNYGYFGDKYHKALTAEDGTELKLFVKMRGTYSVEDWKNAGQDAKFDLEVRGVKDKAWVLLSPLYDISLEALPSIEKLVTSADWIAKVKSLLEDEDDFDARQYLSDAWSAHFELDGKRMSWNFCLEEMKDISMYNGAATFKLHYFPNEWRPAWTIDIRVHPPWFPSYREAYLYKTRCESERMLDKRIQKAADYVRHWHEKNEWGFKIYKPLNSVRNFITADGAENSWRDFVNKHQGDLPTRYDQQTEQTAAAWLELLRQFYAENGEAMPVVESDEFDARAFLLDSSSVHFKLDDELMSWNFGQESKKDIELYGGVIKLKLRYLPDEWNPMWEVVVAGTTPWETGFNRHDIALTRCASERLLSKRIEQALVKARDWYEKNKWGLKIFAITDKASSVHFLGSAWYDFAEKHGGDLPTEYENQTEQSAAAWAELVRQFYAENGAAMPVVEAEEFDAREFLLGDRGQQIVDRLKELGYQQVQINVRTSRHATLTMNNIVWPNEDEAFIHAGPLGVENDVRRVVKEVMGGAPDVYNFSEESGATDYVFKICDPEHMGIRGRFEAQDDFDAREFLLSTTGDEEVLSYLSANGFKMRPAEDYPSGELPRFYTVWSKTVDSGRNAIHVFRGQKDDKLRSSRWWLELWRDEKRDRSAGMGAYWGAENFLPRLEAQVRIHSAPEEPAPV